MNGRIDFLYLVLNRLQCRWKVWISGGAHFNKRFGSKPTKIWGYTTNSCPPDSFRFHKVPPGPPRSPQVPQILLVPRALDWTNKILHSTQNLVSFFWAHNIMLMSANDRCALDLWCRYVLRRGKSMFMCTYMYKLHT